MYTIHDYAFKSMKTDAFCSYCLSYLRLFPEATIIIRKNLNKKEGIING